MRTWVYSTFKGKGVVRPLDKLTYLTYPRTIYFVVQYWYLNSQEILHLRAVLKDSSMTTTGNRFTHELLPVSNPTWELCGVEVTARGQPVVSYR